MDADVSMSSEDEYLQFFELTPTHFPWRAPRPREIEERRARMSDLLIFDILLSSGGIRQPHTIYPPADPEALEELLRRITRCHYDGLKKDCLVYFLLKWHQDGREDEFKLKRCIPPQFAALADAYWHLDSGINITRAVAALSDARLNREYPSKVLQALSLSDNVHYLIRTYIRTAKPSLTEPEDIDAYTIALAESSLMEAWSYQRTFSEASDTRKRLVRKVLDWCLMPKPRLAPLTNLLALPLSPYEQTLVHSYALDPPSQLPPSAISIIQDLVCVRLVQNGQHAAAIKLDRQYASVPRSDDRAKRAAHDRRQMMDELMSAMPSAERQLLELELEQFAHGRGLSGSIGKGKAVDMSMSMSMSWEHISPPNMTSPSASIAPPAQPISQRSGAPRFGGPAPTLAANIDLFPSISRATPPSAPPQMPKPPSQEPLVFGSFSAQPAGSTSTSANGWKPKSTPNGTAPTLFAGLGASRQSLFETAGSANAAPNAFYQPPTSASAKRPLLFGSMVSRPNPPAPPVSVFASLSGQPAPSTSAKSARSGRKSAGGADTSIVGPHEVDISMLSDLSESDPGRGDESSASVARALDDSADMDDMTAEFSVSVFGTSASAGRRKIATNTGARIARTETEAKLPPGAFLPEDEPEKDEPQQQSVSTSQSASAKGRTKRPRVSTSARTAAREPSPVAEEPEPQPEPRSARTRTSARARKVKDQDLGRSIPGSLMDDEDEDSDDGEPQPQPQQHIEEEEEDEIAPLPTTPARRPPRKSRAATAEVTAAAATPRATRRSSRLSVVSSVGSSSPEPLSPQKPSARLRKSARATSASTTGGRGSTTTTAPKTRKKRA